MNPLSALGPTPLITGSSADAPVKGTGGQEMGKEEFLRLLVTQLSNQDPLNPMDGQQFAAQLAQFSSVEQLVNISSALGTQAEAQGLVAQSINSGVAAGLIGKEVSAVTDTFSLGTEGDAPLGVTLEQPADRVRLVVRDASGEIVRTIEETNLGAGEHALAWDGKNDDGVRLDPGRYTFEIEATSGEDTAVGATPLVRGRVDRVSFGADGIRLWVGGAALPMSTVQTVAE